LLPSKGDPKPIFNQDNVDSLLGHLTGGSLAYEIVEAVSSATSEEEASAVIAAILDGRVVRAREAANAGS
jgi:surfactin synthase thioesterase subunit